MRCSPWTSTYNPRRSANASASAAGSRRYARLEGCWRQPRRVSPPTSSPCSIGIDATGSAPACGAALLVTDGGFSRTCPGCGAQHFPRTDPAVIVLVEHDGRALLGRQTGLAPAGSTRCSQDSWDPASRSRRRSSARSRRSPASPPTTRVSSDRSRGRSPLSVMLGFEARSDGGEPVPRDGELEDVRWFTREEIGAGLSGRSSDAGDAAGDLDLVFPDRAVVRSRSAPRCQRAAESPAWEFNSRILASIRLGVHPEHRISSSHSSRLHPTLPGPASPRETIVPVKAPPRS